MVSPPQSCPTFDVNEMDRGTQYQSLTLIRIYICASSYILHSNESTTAAGPNTNGSQFFVCTVREERDFDDESFRLSVVGTNYVCLCYLSYCAG